MTKNLEDIERGFREEFFARSIPGAADQTREITEDNIADLLKEFADTLLDACEGAVVPGELSFDFEDSVPSKDERDFGEGFNSARYKVLKNFFTFRTGGEKRV